MSRFQLVAQLMALMLVGIPTVTSAERGDMPNQLAGHERAAVDGAGDARRVVLGAAGHKEHAAAEDWIEMPGGSRPAYIGIHGGTVPVSLLATRGGSAMVAMVGETGSDFLYVLRGGRNQSSAANGEQTEAAAELLAAAKASDGGRHPATVALEGTRTAAMPDPGANGTVLFASTPEGSVPVIYASGRSFESLDIAMTDWTPFGLTDTPMDHDSSGKMLADKKNAKKNKQAAKAARTAQAEKAARDGKTRVSHEDKADKAPRLPRNEKGPVSSQGSQFSQFNGLTA